MTRGCLLLHTHFLLLGFVQSIFAKEDAAVARVRLGFHRHRALSWYVLDLARDLDRSAQPVYIGLFRFKACETRWGRELRWDFRPKSGGIDQPKEQKMAEEVTPVEATVREIRRKTRKKHSAEEKMRIVLEGLRGEEKFAETASCAALSLLMKAFCSEPGVRACPVTGPAG